MTVVRRQTPEQRRLEREAAQRRETLRATRESMEQVERNAVDGWNDACDDVIFRLCQTREFFTTDDILDAMERYYGDLHEDQEFKCALGPRVAAAMRSEWMEEWERVPSRRSTNHRLTPVYKSAFIGKTARICQCCDGRGKVIS